VVQAALKLVLEPIFEADFKPCSYGFRPRRRAQDAIAEIHFYGTHGYRWTWTRTSRRPSTTSRTPPSWSGALGQGRMRNEKLPALAEALSGVGFGPEHAHAAASLLRAIDLLEAELRELQERVTAHLVAIPASWRVDADGVTGPEAGRAGGAAALPAADRLDEIPGLGREAAAALFAEIGLDMSRFATPQALVSWAGLTPTADQSGPRKGRGKKGHGNTYAKRIAVLAAYAAANTDTFLGERFRRLAVRQRAPGRPCRYVTYHLSLLLAAAVGRATAIMNGALSRWSPQADRATHRRADGEDNGADERAARTSPKGRFRVLKSIRRAREPGAYRSAAPAGAGHAPVDLQHLAGKIGPGASGRGAPRPPTARRPPRGRRGPG